MAEAGIETTPQPSSPATPPPDADPAASPTAAGEPPSAAADAPAPAAGTVEPASPPAPAPADGGAPSLGAGGGTPEPDAAPSAPSDWPANWAELMAGDDPKALTYFKRYNQPGNVGKALMAMRQKMDAGETARAKPDGTDDAALNEWRAQAGIPDESKGYLENMPDGLVIGEDDMPIAESFAAYMHGKDASPNVVHDGLGWYLEHEQEVIAARAELDQKGRATNEDTMRARWGQEYRVNLNGVTSLFNSHGAAGLLDRFFEARFADGSLVGDDPDTLEFLSQVNRTINPHGVITPAEGQTAIQTIKTRMTELNALMSDKNSRYWKGAEAEGLQAEWRQLDEARERHENRGGG